MDRAWGMRDCKLHRSRRPIWEIAQKLPETDGS